MRFFFLILFISISLQVSSQHLQSYEKNVVDFASNEDFLFSNKRKRVLLITEACLYSASILTLNQVWYAEYPRSGFHFINDNNEWLQMDKIGHMSTSYYTGVIGINAYKWAGFSRKRSIWYGGMTGSLFLTIIEVLDGTSKEWGASSGDLIANTVGSLLAIGQALKWDEQKIQLKYSYSPTQWAIENPKQLGANHLERALKDYNGQTYWVTFNLKSLLDIESNKFPRWLSLAMGYGGESMRSPYPLVEDNFYRQYYFSLDIDLNKINTKIPIVNTLLRTIGFLKFPFPAFELSNNNISFHPIYY